jgi:large subunit ribosomal protein L9
MKVILLKDIKGLGRRFEEKEVSSGHASNYLIPKKLAVASTTSSAAQIKDIIEKESSSKEKSREELAQNISNISGTTVVIEMKANEKNHLFQKVTKEKISDLLKEKGIKVPPENIELQTAIKETGTYEVPVHVAEGKETSFTLEVKPLG